MYNIRHTTVCHAGQQWHTHCHARQATTRFSPEGRLPKTNGAKCCQQSDQVSPYLTSIHQMVPPKRGRTHLMISLLLIYRPGRMKGWVGLAGWPVVDSLPM